MRFYHINVYLCFAAQRSLHQLVTFIDSFITYLLIYSLFIDLFLLAFHLHDSPWAVLIISLQALTVPSFFYCHQNTDAALLPCISYPAFALDDEVLFSQTLDKVVRKLKGKYGFKRFLRDGYRTSLEDPNRRYYKPAEIKVSKNIPYHIA